MAYYIGVDLGGTNIAVGICDGDLKIVKKGSVPTKPDRAPELIVKDMADLSARLLKECGIPLDEVASVGIATPGTANSDTGVVEYSNNIPFFRFPIADVFKSFLPVKQVLIENDANAAALAEALSGAAKGTKKSVMITLGTGVGSGIVINGEVVYGHDGFAGELGHTCAVRHNGRRCNCGKEGCLETYASATGVARTAREWLEMSDEPSSLRSLDRITSKDVYEAAKEGDKLALKIFEFTGRILGEKFADFIEFSAPEAIVLFGGLARAKEFLVEPIQKAMDENVLPLWRGKVKLVFSQLKESDAAILGASALAWEL